MGKKTQKAGMDSIGKKTRLQYKYSIIVNPFTDLANSQCQLECSGFQSFFETSFLQLYVRLPQQLTGKWT